VITPCGTTPWIDEGPANALEETRLKTVARTIRPLMDPPSPESRGALLGAF
jgi:hypothetical protein